MIRLFSVLLGMIAMGIVSAIGYFTNVSFFNILLRGVGAFFLFYIVGTFCGVVIVKNIIDVFEKRHKEFMEQEEAEKAAMQTGNDESKEEV